MAINTGALNTASLNLSSALTQLRASHKASYTYLFVVKATHRTGYQESLRAAHKTGWKSLTKVINSHQTGYKSADHIRSSHKTGYKERIAIIHRTGYASKSIIRALHKTGYASKNVIRIATVHKTGYASKETVRALHKSGYKDLVLIKSSHKSFWYAVTSIRTSHKTGYSGTLPSGVRTSHKVYYRILDQSVTILTGTCKIIIGAMEIPIKSASIYSDESSTYWQAQIELSDSFYYKFFSINTNFTLNLFNKTFALTVDSRNRSRSIDDSGNYEVRCTISALSPLCWYDTPRTENISVTFDTPSMASSIVTQILGSVTWNMIDWMIPAYRLAVEDASPLSVAKQVVEAAGGLIESQPDGSIVCRHKWPVAADIIGSATPDYTFGDADLFEISEDLGNNDLTDKVRICDAEASYQDSLEFVVDETDPLKGIIYAYPSPWRDHLYITSSRNSPPLWLSSDSIDTKTVTEQLEFTNGTATTSKPIMTLSTIVWQDSDLGSVTFTPYTTQLTAGMGTTFGYSIAHVTYSYKFMKANVQSDVYEDAQLLLVEQL